MDKKKFNALITTHETAEKGLFTQYVIEGLENYVVDGTPFHSQISLQSDFDTITKLIGVDTVKQENVLDYCIQDSVTGHMYHREEGLGTPQFSDEMPLWAAFQQLADAQSVWADNPNDYRATMLLKLDESTTVALGQESWDVSDDDAMKFEYSHWLAVLNTDDIQNYESWRVWDLNFFDSQKYAREQDQQQLERETAEGVLNLSRLEEGDRVRIVEKMLQRKSVYGDWHYPALSEEQRDKRWNTDLTVLEPGSQPVCSMTVKDNDGKDATRRVRIVGGGNWTTRRQNPVQTQEKAITPSYGYISKQQHLLFVDQETGDMILSDNVIESIDGF
jgi:hypothetical protein